MIDTHAHLTDERLNSQIEAVLARAREAGVERLIIPGTNLADVKQVINLTEKYGDVYGLAGIYPGNVEEIEDVGGAVDEIAAITEANKKIVGIGEIGLDCYWNKRNIEKQKVFFKAQLELAIKLKLPAVIHMREAEAEMKGVLSQMEKLPRGQFHCFAGSDAFLEFVLGKGFYVSYCGNITYPSASSGRLRELVKKVPREKLLLETDSPYLAPEGRRGSLNEPANVKILAEYIAKLIDVPLETLINQTTENAQCLFFDG